MHIDTCKAIKGVIETVIISEFIKINVDMTEAKGKGFNKMVLIFNEEREYLVKRIADLCKEIGWLNGEGLWIKIEGRRIYLS